MTLTTPTSASYLLVRGELERPSRRLTTVVCDEDVAVDCSFVLAGGPSEAAPASGRDAPGPVRAAYAESGVLGRGTYGSRRAGRGRRRSAPWIPSPPRSSMEHGSRPGCRRWCGTVWPVSLASRTTAQGVTVVRAGEPCPAPRAHRRGADRLAARRPRSRPADHADARGRRHLRLVGSAGGLERLVARRHAPADPGLPLRS